MKRNALLLASSTILLSPMAMAENAKLDPNAPFIVAQEQPAAEADPQEALRLQAEQAQKQAEQEAARQAEEAQRAAEEAKQQAAEAAKAAQAEEAQRAEEAKRAAAEEAERQLEAQKAAQEEAKRQADEAQKAAEADAAKQAEEAKKAAAEEAAAAEKAQQQAAEQAKQQAEEARKAAEEEALKQADQDKKAAEQQAEKAASEAEAARKAAEEAAAAEKSGAEKAAAEEAAKAAETEAAQKAAEAEAAQKAAEGAAKAQQEQPTAETPAAKPEAPEAGKPQKPRPPKTDAAKDPAPEPQQPSTTTTETPPVPVPEGQQPPATTTETTPPVVPAQPETPVTAEPAPLPENVAPVLDSAKENRPREGGKKRPGGKGDTATAPAPVQVEPAVPVGPPPTTDAEAQQQQENPVRFEPVRQEEGKRVKRERRPERPRDVEVLQQIDDRTIFEINNNIFVESPDRPRLSREAKEVYYEDLPRGRVRETIVRPNGVEVVTIRNRYGDVIQRSRILPDGREVVLSYASDYDTEEQYEWRDPGLDLPPMQLNIPVNDYILDAEELPEDRIYDFLARPPVERVERIYSVDEVKRSARIRDKVRRIDLDTITFGFGSADIAEDQIQRMENVANAMLEVLEKNPAETFLIEGHTDAVGKDQANLVLSDRRAESVAEALTNVFGIPPENMATQGYGERYLKIKSDSAEQQNRRVAIRRITSLVAPVASR